KVGDLDDVIQLLENNKLTRQAYLPIFHPEDTGATAGQRVPCTLGYYFWVDPDGKLNMEYTIRSCDAFRHLRNDIYFTCMLLLYVADSTKLKYGDVNFIIHNLHTFENDDYALT